MQTREAVLEALLEAIEKRECFEGYAKSASNRDETDAAQSYERTVKETDIEIRILRWILTRGPR